ncbi:MAG: hypothetical protein QOC92_4811 [Acidimicrobiaceae bacterium]
MASDIHDVSNPPRTYFSVWQRLFRGYGPLAVLIVTLLLMSLLIPSKVQNAGTNVSTGGSRTATTAAGGNTGAGGATASGSANSGAAGGGGAAAGGGGGTPTPGSPCADRPEQVAGDPYSPPCIAFSGDNGGATYHGVTATEIHVSVRVLNEKGFQQTLAALAGATLTDTPDDIKRTFDALAQYFNEHYQFYGRKIVFDYYNGVGSNTDELLGKGRDKAEADATTVKSLGSFADMSANSEPYANALAQNDVVGFGDPYLSVQWHDEHAPYIWSIASAGTDVANFAAEYAVKKLCGKPADRAGGDLKGKPRKFASFAPENSWYQESVQVARQTQQAAGCDPGVNVQYQLDLGTMSNQAANLIAQMQSQGVTTILCGCDPIIPVFLSSRANSQGYYPEFIIVGTALTDTDIVGQLWDQNFAAHAFGVSSLTEPQPPQQSIGYAAYRTVRQDEPAFSVELIYYQLAQMAIGLQMAGPNLTPQSFSDGMFAYPRKLGPAGSWGFGEHDYTTADDGREICWDPSAVSNYNQKKGAFVETDHARYAKGTIPGGDPLCPIPP